MKEPDSSRVDASEGESLLMLEEFENLSLKMSFKLHFIEGDGTG